MENQEIDISEIIAIVLKRIWLIIGMVLLGVLAAVLVNIFMRPVYEASTLLMINKEEAGKLDVSHLGSFTSEEDYYRTQYQLLESRSLLESVYEQLDLGQYEEFANPGGIGKLHKALKIVPITRSRLVNVKVRAYDPQLAAEISNTLTRTFVEENINNRISMGKDVILALERKEKSSSDQELLNSMPQVVNSDFIKSLKQQAANLELQRAQLSAKYTDQHPETVSLEKQLKTIREQINTETRRLVQSIKIELSGQFSGNNIRIIDPAIVPQNPVFPRKLLNIAIGILGGGVLGLLLVFALEFLDQSVKSSEEMNQKLDIPFLGVVTFERMKKKDCEYATMLKQGNVLKAENVRNIRTMLDFAQADSPHAPFLITSAVQGEGKSNFSTNLAISFAQAGKKVLLIDGDLRRSRLHQIFKLSLEKGLSNIWNATGKQADYESNVQTVQEIPNLSIMTSGTRPPNPAELLSTPKLADFVNWAAKTYDQVIVDCPASLPVADTLLWGKYIPRAIYVIKYGKTNAKASKSCVDKLKTAGVKILGGVITGYQAEGLTYGKYGYYKSYHYYSDEKK